MPRRAGGGAGRAGLGGSSRRYSMEGARRGERDGAVTGERRRVRADRSQLVRQISWGRANPHLHRIYLSRSAPSPAASIQTLQKEVRPIRVGLLLPTKHTVDSAPRWERGCRRQTYYRDNLTFHLRFQKEPQGLKTNPASSLRS